MKQVRCVKATAASVQERDAIETLLSLRFPHSFRQDWTEKNSYFYLFVVRNRVCGVVNLVHTGTTGSVWNLYCLGDDNARDGKDGCAKSLLRTVQRQWAHLERLDATFSIFSPADICTRPDVELFRCLGFRNRVISHTKGMRMSWTPEKKKAKRRKRRRADVVLN